MRSPAQNTFSVPLQKRTAFEASSSAARSGHSIRSCFTWLYSIYVGQSCSATSVRLVACAEASSWFEAVEGWVAGDPGKVLNQQTEFRSGLLSATVEVF